MGCFPVLPAVRTRKRTTDTDSKVCRRKPTKINWNFSKKCLTNSQECAIIKAQRGKQGRSRRQDPRESCKSLMTKSSTARCSCVRDTNVNQTSQAEKMSRIRRIQKLLLLWCSSNGKTPAEQEENGGSTPPHHTIILQGNGWDFVLYQ